MPTDYTAQNRQLFDAVASTYDQLCYLHLAALALAQRVPVGAGQRVLDIATGTGVIAGALGARGATVTGLDLSPRMVEQATQNNALPNVTFAVADALALPYPDHSVDTITCGAGLFFMSDMLAALSEWRRVLRPGGQVYFSAFGRGLLGGLPQLWREELLAYQLRPAAPPLGRLPTPEAAQNLLQEAGFCQVQASLHPLTYTLPTPQARWDDIAAGLEGAMLQELDEPARHDLQAKHLARLAQLPWPQRVAVPLIVAQGEKGDG